MKGLDIFTYRSDRKPLTEVSTKSMPWHILNIVPCASPPFYCRSCQIRNGHFSSVFQWCPRSNNILFQILYPRVCILSCKFNDVHPSWLDCKGRPPLRVISLFCSPKWALITFLFKVLLFLPSLVVKLLPLWR